MKDQKSGKALLEVLGGRIPARRPIWFMRQAGRYLPEYRKVREIAGSFLDLCYAPELAAEVTLQPLRRFDIDGAIVFADILVVPHAMGLELRFEEGEGPVLETVRDARGVSGLKALGNSDQVKLVCETVGLVKGQLPEGVGLIGFCGGPWTVASYMVEGGSSDRQRAKLAAFGREEWFEELIGRLVEESVEYLAQQIVAGAEAIQIFDSWAGDLPEGTRKLYVERPLAEIVKRLRERFPQVPAIVFARGIGVDHLGIQEKSGSAGIGIETELPLSWARRALGEKCAIQGNLDPVALLGGEKIARGEALALCEAVPMGRHIFNLGHGIRPGTAPEVIAAVVDAIREYDRELGPG